MKEFIVAIVLSLIVLSGTAESKEIAKGWYNSSEMLAEVSNQSGVDIRKLAAIAAIESSFRPWVKADTSSATGLFQFTNRTWRVTLNSYGNAYGLTPKASRQDPYANAAMGAEYLKENERVLTRMLKRKPTFVDVYMAHMIAPRRVAALDQTSPHAAMDLLYPKLAQANPSIFYNKDGSARTVREFRKLIMNRVYKAYKTYETVAVRAYSDYLNRKYASALVAANNKIDCNTSTLVRLWGNRVKEQSLQHIKLAVDIAREVRQHSSMDNKQRNPRDRNSDAVTHIVYVDRRWIV